jgi:hypothetical protein
MMRLVEYVARMGENYIYEFGWAILRKETTWNTLVLIE